MKGNRSCSGLEKKSSAEIFCEAFLVCTAKIYMFSETFFRGLSQVSVLFLLSPLLDPHFSF